MNDTWSPFIHSVFGEISKKVRLTEESRVEKKPWVFVISGLELKVREIGGSTYTEILELDPTNGDIESKITDGNSGKTMEMDSIITKYLTDKNMNLSQITVFEKIKIIQDTFEKAYDDYAHFR